MSYMSYIVTSVDFPQAKFKDNEFFFKIGKHHYFGDVNLLKSSIVSLIDLLAIKNKDFLKIRSLMKEMDSNPGSDNDQEYQMVCDLFKIYDIDITKISEDDFLYNCCLENLDGEDDNKLDAIYVNIITKLSKMIIDNKPLSE